MAKKTIITVATTGAWPKKENNPNVPMTPQEIANDVYDSSLFLNPPKFLEELGRNMQEWNVKPEIEVFDPGMIANAAYYLKKGVLKAPLHFQMCMGCANGIPGSMKNLVFMKETMDTLCPGSPSLAMSRTRQQKPAKSWGLADELGAVFYVLPLPGVRQKI